MEGGPGAPRGSNTDRSSRWRDYRMTLGVVRGAQPNHAIVEARSAGWGHCCQLTTARRRQAVCSLLGAPSGVKNSLTLYFLLKS